MISIAASMDRPHAANMSFGAPNGPISSTAAAHPRAAADRSTAYLTEIYLSCSTSSSHMIRPPKINGTVMNMIKKLSVVIPLWENRLSISVSKYGANRNASTLDIPYARIHFDSLVAISALFPALLPIKTLRIEPAIPNPRSGIEMVSDTISGSNIKLRTRSNTISLRIRLKLIPAISIKAGV
ncbi:MAG: hypothetical protein ACYS8W_09115 [Planctomycetota bacterium]